MIRAVRFTSLLCLGLAAPAWADGLPFFAGGDGATSLAPAAPWDAATPSHDWSGLTVGTSVFAGIGSGHGGRNGFGGDATVGYYKELDNRIVIGAQAGAGYLPGLTKYGPRGYDFGLAEVKVGYDMGRLMPYVTFGAGLAKPTSTLNGGPTGFGAVNDMFVGSQPSTTLTTVGAGVDYAVTDHLTVGVQVNSVQQRGGWGAPPLVPQPGMP